MRFFRFTRLLPMQLERPSGSHTDMRTKKHPRRQQHHWPGTKNRASSLHASLQAVLLKRSLQSHNLVYLAENMLHQTCKVTVIGDADTNDTESHVTVVAETAWTARNKPKHASCVL